MEAKYRNKDGERENRGLWTWTVMYVRRCAGEICVQSCFVCRLVCLFMRDYSLSIFCCCCCCRCIFRGRHVLVTTATASALCKLLAISKRNLSPKKPSSPTRPHSNKNFTNQQPTYLSYLLFKHSCTDTHTCTQVYTWERTCQPHPYLLLSV